MNSSRILWPAEGWLRRGLQLTVIVGIVAAALMPLDGHAQDKVLNLYSARHYQTDEALYSDFTKQTGIKINRIELGDEQLLQRLKTEGANSPADVVLLVDAARLWRAQVDGLFQPVQSKVLAERIPANLRSNDGTWFGFSPRARAIVYDKSKLKAEDVDTYEKLADPKLKGLVCTRSGSHPYMLSLIGALIERNGEAKTEEWARGMVANMARPPRGGDTDQIKGVAAGECGVALTNSYYWLRLVRSTDPKDKEVVGEGRLPVAEPGDDGHARQHLRRRRGEERAEQGQRGPVPRVPVGPAGADLLRRREQRVARREGRQDRERRAGGARHTEVRERAGVDDRQEPDRGAAHPRSRRVSLGNERPAHVHLHLQRRHRPSDPRGGRRWCGFARRRVDAARRGFRVRLLPRSGAAGDS